MRYAKNKEGSVRFSRTWGSFQVGGRHVNFFGQPIECVRVEHSGELEVGFYRLVRWWHDRAWRGVALLLAAEVAIGWLAFLILAAQ